MAQRAAERTAIARLLMPDVSERCVEQRHMLPNEV